MRARSRCRRRGTRRFRRTSRRPRHAQESWPRDLAVSRDGKTLLAALNLADYAAVIDTASHQARFVKVGSYPYGAAISRDGKYGLVSNESDGTVSVIDLASAKKVKDIQVGPHLSHPEAIATDPKLDRAYVAVTEQDLIAVINLSNLTVERTLTVERRQGIGTAPVEVNVTSDGCFLLSADSGEDALAVFALPNAPRAHLQEPAEAQAGGQARSSGGLPEGGGRRRPPPVAGVAAGGTRAGRLLSGRRGRNSAA